MPRGRRPVSSLAGLALACLAFAAAAQVVAGRWELIDYDQDHPTDKSQIALWLQAGMRVKNPAPTGPYDAQALPLLSIQCLHGRSEFFINLNFEVPTGAVAATYRLDESAPVHASWKSEGIVIAPGDKVSFVRSLLGKRKLFLDITFPGTEATSTVFEIAGIDTALQRLRPHCSW
jgi:Type VI secretion system VasI, EvfG, VC_A0118